jgi:NAD+ kinase
MRCIGVLVHPTRPVLDAVEVLDKWAQDNDAELVQIAVGNQPTVAPSGRVEGCDLITALGGDGTVLKALHVSARTGKPVLGVAYGSLGALTAVPETELHTALERFAAGDWFAAHLPALEIGAPDGPLATALNDCVMSRRKGTQLILDVYIDRELYVRLAGDGVIVATALGSSAYSMAAGGAVLSVGTDAFICTPLAMHGGCAPPLVVPADREVELVAHPTFGGFDVEIDGRDLTTEATTFRVTCRHDYATLVTLEPPLTGLTRLRDRGLIADSPRITGQDRRQPPASPPARVS